MNGTVDEFGRAFVRLNLRSPRGEQVAEISAWVDTAFNGELVIPRQMISMLGLEQSAGLRARLADGNEVILETYAGILEWFGDQRAIEVIANDGQFPLLGVGLLLGHRLIVDYTELTVSIK